MATLIFLTICAASEGFLIFALVRFRGEAKKLSRAAQASRSAEDRVALAPRKHRQLQVVGDILQSNRGSAVRRGADSGENLVSARERNSTKIVSTGGTRRA
jgi:hypothetical protein